MNLYKPNGIDNPDLFNVNCMHDRVFMRGNHHTDQGDMIHNTMIIIDIQYNSNVYLNNYLGIQRKVYYEIRYRVK